MKSRMILTVIGGSGSGKSEYAEQRVMEFAEKAGRYAFAQQKNPVQKIYLATMKAEGDAAQARIRRHLQLREGKGFQTIECPEQVSQAISQMDAAAHQVVLLECVSNLAANEMFRADGMAEPARVYEKLCRELSRLAASCADLVLVTNDIHADGCRYDAATASYISLLGRVNQYLASISDEVVEVVYGCPIIQKGGREEKRQCVQSEQHF